MKVVYDTLRSMGFFHILFQFKHLYFEHENVLNIQYTKNKELKTVNTVCENRETLYNGFLRINEF